MNLTLGEEKGSALRASPEEELVSQKEIHTVLTVVRPPSKRDWSQSNDG